MRVPHQDARVIGFPCTTELWSLGPQGETHQPQEGTNAYHPLHSPCLSIFTTRSRRSATLAAESELFILVHHCS